LFVKTDTDKITARDAMSAASELTTQQVIITAELPQQS